MPAGPRRPVGHTIAAARRLARLTQKDLAEAADVSYGTIRAIERGGRYPSDSVLEAIAGALGVDPSRLLGHQGRTNSRVHDQLPALSQAIATYDVPEDGPVRPLRDLHAVVSEAANWRLGAQYLRIAQTLPSLLAELARALHTVSPEDSTQVARLLVRAYRSADAVAYKFGARDLSARLIERMRSATAQAEDALVNASVAYVRTETFFAARAHAAGLRTLEHALDTASASDDAEVRATRGTLHMRAAVIAGRAGDADAASSHLDHARSIADSVPESVYEGTAFGSSSVRAHEVSVAVSLGERHLQRALDIARDWAPPKGLPAERRSGFYIEVARAQLWAGLRDDAYESLTAARRIAPQHAREHPWVREDVKTLCRLKRANREDLSNYAVWCHAV